MAPIVPAPVCAALNIFSSIKEQFRWRADEKTPSGRRLNNSSCFIFPQYRPDKSCQFTRDRHRHFTGHFAAMHQMPIAFSKPLSSSVGYIDDPLRLPVSSFPQCFADVAGMSIVPGNFHQNPPNSFIASSGDRASLLLFTTGELRAGKPQITH